MKDLVLGARLALAAYLEDEDRLAEAVRAIGGELLATFLDDAECKGFLATLDGETILALSGTHFSENTSIAEILCNLRGDAIKVAGGRVADGYFTPFLRLASRIAETPDTVLGHSMGGVRAHYARYVWPGAEVLSYGAPKGADGAFWLSYYPDGAGLTRVVNEHDFAPAWPYEGPWRQPVHDEIWIHGGQLVATDERAGLSLSEPDHMPERYLANLKAALSPPLAKVTADEGAGR